MHEPAPAAANVAAAEETGADRPSPLGSALLAVVRTANDGLLIATAMVAIVFSTIQWSTPSIIGIDGYYHIKMAWLMAQQGWRILLPLDFPWLQLTVLNPTEFTNHHLLFHLMLAPFTLIDLRIGAKLAAVVFASTALLLLYQVMAENRVRWSLIWLGLALASAGPFLYRLSMTRRQSLTVLLLLLTLLVAFRGKARWLLLIGFLFTWLFDGFPLLLGVCGAIFLGQWWEQRRPTWGLVLYPAVGVLLGNVVNPYFPNNILFSYLHMLPKVFQLLGLSHSEDVIQVGNEWYPYDVSYLLESSWLALLMVPLGFVAIVVGWLLALRDRQTTDVPEVQRPSVLAASWAWARSLDGRVAALAIIAVTFLVLYLRSRRWVEAEPAFATLFCAFAWNHCVFNRLSPRLPRFSLARQVGLALLACLLIAPQMLDTVERAQDDARRARDHTRYRGAALWLSQNTPAGARVFATDWDDFPELFFWNTHNTYLLGLDPTYMYLHDGPLYLQWRSITRGEVADPGAIIRDEYRSGWVFTDLQHAAFLRRAATDPLLEEVYRDRVAVVFAVRGWTPGP
ncbi:MAG: hypothetical protein IT306_03765 [Chloroflexi bacterium]|nr:hypothetical protein [Chloroflexota bacterium]